MTRRTDLQGGLATTIVLAMPGLGCAARTFHKMTSWRQSQAEPIRVYRAVGYGALLDVFLNMRPERRAPPTRCRPVSGAGQLAGFKRA